MSYIYTGSGGSGALVQLETHTASDSAELDFTTCLTNSSYHIFEVTLNGMIPATNDAKIGFQMSTNGGSTYDTTSGNYGWLAPIFQASSINNPNGNTSDTAMYVSNDITN